MEATGVDTLETSLRELGRVSAPAGFAGRALHAAGVGDRFTPIETPIGRFYAVWNSTGVSAVTAERPAGMPEAGRMPKRPRFNLSALTPFERSVLTKTAKIPRGEVRTYSWVAREIGHPAAVRAVGSALARNPIPILIPCHRVVRSDGVIGQYGAGGPAAKRTILASEGAEPDELERLARQGVRYLGSRTTRIFCNPTCHDARRVRPPNLVRFRDEREAAGAGYRPCRHCRPAAIAA